MESAIGELDACIGKLTAAALTVASAGVWKRWSAGIPAGTIMQFNAESLMDADDPVVQRLAMLLQEMAATLADIDDDS